MPNIFGANIAKIINKELGPLLFSQTLIKISNKRDKTNPSKMVESRTTYPCRGFIDDFKDVFVNGTVMKLTGRRIIILGDSLPVGIVPAPKDEIIAENTTFTIVEKGVVRDPAGATYECQTN